jgi:hypothetical protein
MEMILSHGLLTEFSRTTDEILISGSWFLKDI